VRTIGERLKELIADWETRERRAFKASDVNEFLGGKANSGYFSRLVRDERRKPDPHMVDKVAAYFGAEFEWLYYGRGAKYAGPSAERNGAIAEQLRMSLGGHRPLAPGEGPDNLDAVRLFRRGRYSAEFIADLRAELASRGISPNDQSPEEWDALLYKRWIRLFHQRAADAPSPENEVDELEKRLRTGTLG
jgi:hypothetical protein